MASVFALQTRLKELSATISQIHPLINRLRNFTAAIGQGDEARLELGAEIHARLKETEEEMELLKVDVDALESAPIKRKGFDFGEKEAERERVVAMARRLDEDLKRTRGEFRAAQLQAKRNAEAAQRKERELLLAKPRDSEGRRKPMEKLTQDDLVVNASSDVTSALRRTYQLMQTELSRSQFATQTLEQSTAALSSLSESYTNLDTLLSSSRTLVSSLLRSQKSDTWYLETAFYILIGTITWLVFRRLLYGPLWWLVWLPIKLFYRLTLTLLGAVGVSSATAQLSSSAAMVTSSPMAVPTVGSGQGQYVTASSGDGEAVWSQTTASATPANADSVVEQIGQIVEDSQKEAEAKKEETNVDDISPDERKRQEEIPRNPKKRMYEDPEAAERQARKDEL
ncbi:Sec20 domain protein [Paecilomyces variotii No. 5]|uniref:Sec20 domain protein n=1 Tax=Byssochlamys spectabilis (strain No. 5 / NBRC 109023) TaxID=1356009 RepID=V5I5W5_BYSSN|nr:Sec20 domain protein [Paecilomyces variotii No. 5]